MNIFVGNLTQDITEDELRALFAPHGRVLGLSMTRDAASGASRGFGYVELETEYDASIVIRSMQGSQLRGRTLTISEAHPKADRRHADRAEQGAKCSDHERRGHDSDARRLLRHRS